MTTPLSELDPYANDPLGWGHSMAHLAPLIVACLDAVNASTVTEVGAYAGVLTEHLLAWAHRSGGRVIAVDPAPQPGLVQLAAADDQLDLVERPSLEALSSLTGSEVVVIDGDHNYYTVLSELRAIAARDGEGLPLLLFHDVCWPHGRRDDYFAPEQIPEEFRLPQVGGQMGIFPGEPGVRRDGLPYPRSAAREGGPHNGVLTAVEDFVAEHGGLELAVVPAFFGLGAVWSSEATWAPAVREILGPWDRHPLLIALEANRVRNIAQAQSARQALWEEQAQRSAQETLLRRMLESSSFRAAEWLSRLRLRAGVAPDTVAISREQIRSVLGSGTNGR